MIHSMYANSSNCNSITKQIKFRNEYKIYINHVLHGNDVYNFVLLIEDTFHSSTKILHTYRLKHPFFSTFTPEK